MADNSSALPIWCDVGKNLNAAYMVVSLGDVTKGRRTSDAHSKKIVKIYSRHLTINSHEASTSAETNGDKNTLVYPGLGAQEIMAKLTAELETDAKRFLTSVNENACSTFSVIPRTCSGLAMCGGSAVQMRLQFEYHTDYSQGRLPKRLLKEELGELRNGCHTVCCRMCGCPVLLPELQFKRVLELPSENWLELAQDWCCHGSSHLTSTAGALEPGERDCFVGEYYIKLHSSAVEPGRLQISPGEEHHFVKCCRCSSILGSVGAEDSSLDVLDFIDVFSIYLYKHSISLTCSNLFRPYCVETFISSCLISKSQCTVNFRFLVQEPLQSGSRQQAHACLWLFNADTAVVTNVECLKTTVKTGIYSIQNKAKYLHVLKVLYKIKLFLTDNDWDDEVDAWRGNATVQTLTFTKETCLHLILLLAKSTNTIAPSLRDMNGFKVGYLRTMKT